VAERAGFEFEGAEVVAVDEAGGEVEMEEDAEAAEAFGLSGVGGFVAEEGEVVGDVVAEEDGVVEGHACGEAAVEAEGGGEALLPCEAGHGDGGDGEDADVFRVLDAGLGGGCGFEGGEGSAVAEGELGGAAGP
jgi:hypothetical protein